MTCYIIDDEQHAINTLLRHVEKTPELTLLHTFTNPAEGLKAIREEVPADLLFLDIDMPELTGLEVIELLPQGIGVIFTTAHQNYALSAFEADAIDFLLKPVSFAKFTKAIEKANNRLSKRALVTSAVPQTSIFINPGVRGKMVQIHFSDILYIEGLKNYVVILTTSGIKHITYLTMSEIGAALPDDQFCRTHKSYIVNLTKIKSVDGNTVHLAEDYHIPLGVTNKELFFKKIAGRTVKSSRK